jgi:hypothetical protein
LVDVVWYRVGHIGGQALLKRKIGTSIEDFRNDYIDRHAPIAIPWCLSNRVTYYAQVSGKTWIPRFDYLYHSTAHNNMIQLTSPDQIHRPLRWTSPELEAKYKHLGINLEDWDAVAEMVFPPVVTIDDYYRPKVGKKYHLEVILPDEKRFLLDEALKHLQGVEPGAVDGERVELIVDGKAVVSVGEWQEVFDGIEAGKVGERRGEIGVFS